MAKSPTLVNERLCICISCGLQEDTATGTTTTFTPMLDRPLGTFASSADFTDRLHSFYDAPMLDEYVNHFQNNKV